MKPLKMKVKRWEKIKDMFYTLKRNKERKIGKKEWKRS